MSLTTMTRLRSGAAAMLLSASHAMPPVSAPSPMTATVHAVDPLRCFSREMPSAHDREVEACEFSTTSWGDSWREGYPEIPPA